MPINNDASDTTSTHRSYRRRTFLKGTGTAGVLAFASGCLGNLGGGGGGGTLKIGASAALTGKYSQEGSTMREGYDLWVQQVNEQGGALEGSEGQGIIGYDKVELTIYDDQSDPSRAVKLYQRLLNEDEVDLLMGPYSSAVSTSVIPIIEQSKTPCVMPMMSDTSVLEERDVSYITQSIAPAYTYVKGAIDIAAANGGNKMAVVYENTAFPTATAEGHIPYAKDKGFEIVHKQAYPKDTNDYTSVLNPIKGQDVDVVMGGGYTPDAIGLTKAAKSLDLQAGIFAWLVGGTQPALVDAVGMSAKAISGDLFWAPFFKTPHSQEFTDAFMKKYADEYDEPNQIDSHSPGGYTGCLVMEQALKNVGELDKEAIAKELHTIKMGVPYGNGKYEVNDKGIQIGQAPSLGQWQGDSKLDREVVWPDQFKTADPIYPHPSWS